MRGRAGRTAHKANALKYADLVRQALLHNPMLDAHPAQHRASQKSPQSILDISSVVARRVTPLDFTFTIKVDIYN